MWPSLATRCAPPRPWAGCRLARPRQLGVPEWRLLFGAPNERVETMASPDLFESCFRPASEGHPEAHGQWIRL